MARRPARLADCPADPRRRPGGHGAAARPARAPAGAPRDPTSRAGHGRRGRYGPRGAGRPRILAARRRFTAHTAAISALTVHLVAALVSWGHPPAFAAAIAG